MNAAFVLGKYEIPFVDTPMQRVVNGRTFYIELFDTHVVTQFAADVEELQDNLLSVWERRYQSLRQVVRRERISAVLIMYNNTCKLWQVQMDVDGSNNEIWFQFIEHKDAKELFDRLEAYYLSTKL